MDFLQFLPQLMDFLLGKRKSAPGRARKGMSAPGRAREGDECPGRAREGDGEVRLG